MIINRFLTRLAFAVQNRTLRKIVLSPDKSSILVCHRGKIVRMNRRCAHQGAPLEDAYIYGNHLVCHWHGCRFSLDQPEKAKAYNTTLSKEDALS
jgi:nitrite reductase/ring-hydroxylating ferredoxin subunit